MSVCFSLAFCWAGERERERALGHYPMRTVDSLKQPHQASLILFRAHMSYAFPKNLPERRGEERRGEERRGEEGRGEEKRRGEERREGRER